GAGPSRRGARSEQARGHHRASGSTRHRVLAMGLFDAIVPPDTASPEWQRLPRITVRPKWVEPPPGPGNADASDETENTPPARSGGLFDDIVPPAGPGFASQTAADASDETDNAAPARSGGLFDNIVPPAGAPASDMAASGGGQ